MIIKIMTEGGNMTPGPAIAQKIGPLGLNMGKIIQEINSATASFKGLKVPVELDIDTKTKQYKIHVSSPPVAELIKKELKIEKGSGERKKLAVGNIAIEQIIKVAKTKHENMLCKDLKSAVKSVVGSCVSLGILVENKDPVEIEKDIEAGNYDSEINQEKSEVTPEKLAQLKEYFENVHSKQEAQIKKAAEEAAAAEAAKAVAAPTTPATGAKTEAGKTAEAGKPAATATGKESAKPAAKAAGKK